MTVYHVPWDASKNMLKEVERLYEKAGTFDCIAKEDLVAIKLHLGELGNPTMCNRSLYSARYYSKKP